MGIKIDFEANIQEQAGADFERAPDVIQSQMINQAQVSADSIHQVPADNMS